MNSNRFLVVVVGPTELRADDPIGIELEKIGAEVRTTAARSVEEIIAVAQGADAVIVGGERFPGPVIESLGRCRIIARDGAGYDNIDVETATERGILVTNVPDVFDNEVANHVMLLLLACAKKLLPLHRAITTGQWSQSRTILSPMGRIMGQVLGIVGFGHIGRQVARRATGFGLQLLVCDPYVPSDVVEKYGAAVADLQTLLKGSDYISVNTALTKETRHLFSEREFRAMKPSAFFINTSRGAVVDEAALIKALEEKWIAGAGLDVLEKEPPNPDNPLLRMDNVVLTPHVASYSDGADVERRVRAAQEVVRVLTGGLPRPIAWLNPEAARAQSR